MTETEYLAFDADSDFRVEYADGQVYMMAGASNNHILITGNIFGYLFNQLLDSNCRIVQSEMRLKIQKKNKKSVYRYPDVMVTCGKPNYIEDAPAATLTNPTILFEVLSSSMEIVDTIQKVEEYRQINSVQDYLIVAQSEVRVMHYQRQIQPKRQWIYTDFTGLDEKIALPSIGCTLSLSEIYRRVEFEAEDETAEEASPE